MNVLCRSTTSPQRLIDSHRKKKHTNLQPMARARWPGESLGVARPPPLVDRLLRADSICFLLCVCMTIGSTFATLYWLFSPSATA